MQIQYQIQFHDFWCVASGLAGGARADILTLKDRRGLPCIPGRTLKGLLREAADVLAESGLADAALSQRLFGECEANEIANEQEKHRARAQGLAFFTNASLDAATAAAIIADENNNLKPALYEVLAATKIDDLGIAEQHTLRRTEAAMPCTLYAAIQVRAEDREISEVQCREFFGHCMQYIKRLGHRRTRGLGRCTIQIIGS